MEEELKRKEMERESKAKSQGMDPKKAMLEKSKSVTKLEDKHSSLNSELIKVRGRCGRLMSPIQSSCGVS